MLKSLATYVESAVVQTLQEIYARFLDLSTNIFDADGRINLVDPSNLSSICKTIVRGCGAGMAECIVSDGTGRTILAEALAGTSERDLRRRYRDWKPRVIKNQMHLGSTPSGGLVAVAYFCRMGLLDFAVPILVPGCSDLSDALLSVAYGGQYIRSDLEEEDQHKEKEAIFKKIWSTVRTSHSHLSREEKENKKNEIRTYLEFSRSPLWMDVTLAAHVIYALGQAMAVEGRQWHDDNEGAPLPWSRENILRVYRRAFLLLSGAEDGCFVTYNRWRQTYDVAVWCDSPPQASEGDIDCHRNEGLLFREIRLDPTLDYLYLPDKSKDPWFVGQGRVVGNLVWAVRGVHRTLRGLINLNFFAPVPRPTDLSMRAMASLAQQVGEFLSMEPLLSHGTSRVSIRQPLERAMRRLHGVRNIRALCKGITSTVFELDGRDPETSCQIWLIDDADYSEMQEESSNVKMLTCYAANDSFPREPQTSPSGDIPQEHRVRDVPLQYDRLRRLIESQVLQPDDLEEVYPALRKSKAFKKGFTPDFPGLNQGHHHLMVVPIRRPGEKGNGLDELAGLLIVIKPLTKYLTDDSYRTYCRLCERMADAVDVVVEQGRLVTEKAVSRLYPGLKADEHTRDTAWVNLRDLLRDLIKELRRLMEVEGASVFLRWGYPGVLRTDSPLALWAANTLLEGPEGSPVIRLRETGELIGPSRYHEVRYRPGEGCTGHAADITAKTVRIADLHAHEARVSRGSIKGPIWSKKCVEVRYEEKGRCGVICAQLRDSKGNVFGILRASSRADGLRFTHYDGQMLQAIGEGLSASIENLVNRSRVERWSRALSTMTQFTQAILTAPSPSPEVETLGLSNILPWAMLLPVVSPMGFGIRRALYLQITRQGTLKPLAGVGGRRSEVDNALRGDLNELLALKSVPSDASQLARLCRLLKKKCGEHLPALKDFVGLTATPEELDVSCLGAVLRENRHLVIGSLDEVSSLDERIRRCMQGEHRESFAYIPVAQPEGLASWSLEFLYIDNLYRDDAGVSEQEAQAVQTFVSILGGLRAKEDIVRRNDFTMMAISHDLSRIFREILSKKDLRKGDTNLALDIEVASLRCEVLQAALDPTRRFAPDIELQAPVAVEDVLWRMTKRKRDFVESQEWHVTIEAPPHGSNLARGNERYLEAVLDQLLDNAVRYTHLSSGQQRVGTAIENDPRDPEHYLRVVVWDTGPGFPDDAADYFGQAPFRCEYRAEGAGIGLLVCKKLMDAWVAERQDDNLDYCSDPEKETRFWIVIPRWAGELPECKPTSDGTAVDSESAAEKKA